MIKLVCRNEDCEYSIEVSEQEFIDNPQYYGRCLCCNALLKIVNLEEVIEMDLYRRAESYINDWAAKFGWDYTLDMIQRNKSNACYRIYRDILRKRGFNVKD